MTNTVTIHEADPQAIISTVNHVAGACKAIVGASAMKIQGRSYIKVEGWQAIAAAHGCTASADTVEAVEGGIRAVATIRRLTDGAILGQAEGFVGDDERMWAQRPLYARRAMAQTRAISRACRSAFAHVVVAMNAGFGTEFSTTPAEEVPPEGFDDRRDQAPRRAEPAPAAPAPAPAQVPAAAGWTADQKAEAKRLADEINAMGATASAEVARVRKDMKDAAPSDVIDTLAALLRTHQDLADAANQPAA